MMQRYYAYDEIFMRRYKRYDEIDMARYDDAYEDMLKKLKKLNFLPTDDHDDHHHSSMF